MAKRIKARPQSNPTGMLPPTLVLKSTVDATVSTDAVVDNLLGHLAPNRHELVLFDINCFAMKSTLLVFDPAPLTGQLMADATLPFAVTLVGNENPQNTTVSARHKAPFSAEVSRTEPLNLSWPRGMISLSHVALPFPPDDPLYGQRPPPATRTSYFSGKWPFKVSADCLNFPPTGCYISGTTHCISISSGGCWSG